MFFNFCLFNCHTHVLVISLTLYYVTSRNIMSQAYYSLYYFITLLTYSIVVLIEYMGAAEGTGRLPGR